MTAMHDREPLPLTGVDPPQSSRPPRPFPVDDATPFHLAARASYLTPILALVPGMIFSAVRGRATSVASALVVAGISLCILSAGVCLALVALGGMRKHGRRHILLPAVIGLFINLLFIGAIVAMWLNYQRGVHAATRAAAVIRPMKPPFYRQFQWS